MVLLLHYMPCQVAQQSPAGRCVKHTGPSRCVAMAAAGKQQLYLGIDYGTSGARATIINDDGAVVSDVKTGYSADASTDWASAWQSSFDKLFNLMPVELKSQVSGVAFDGTSATAMLVDKRTRKQLAAPKLYNEAQSAEAVAAALAICPPAHTAGASTSTLCKLLAWHLEGVWQAASAAGAEPGLLHQADWLAALLHDNWHTSDWNNALKLGFDPQTLAYPTWMQHQPWTHLLPSRVVAPGSPVGHVTAAAAGRTGLQQGCVVAAGTTDSIAAFLAAGVTQPGQAVTSLGSTMAIKMLSTTRVDAAAYGLYSHRLGDAWLVGGASNTGGAVLRAHFTDQQLKELTERIDIDKPTGLQYYPLVKPGERFPVNDPNMQPRLEPRPTDDALFLQGMLEGMSDIEARAYKLMYDMGARPAVQQVLTAGGGAINDKWTELRRWAVGVPVLKSANGEAAYGAAVLARMAVRGS